MDVVNTLVNHIKHTPLHSFTSFHHSSLDQNDTMSIEETNYDSTGRGPAAAHATEKKPAATLNVHSAANQDFSYQNGVVIGFRQLGTMLRRNTILQVTNLHDIFCT